MSSYDYGFTVNESPLSDGGKWENTVSGTWTHPVNVVGNRAQGPGSSSTNDAVRKLTDTAGGGASWGPNQIATVTYRLSGTDIDAEAEVHLRMTMSGGNQITTVECDFIPSSHTTVIATWNGNQGDFTAVGDYGNTDPQNDGDVWEYSITGTSPNIAVAAKKNTVSVGTVSGITGAALNNGNPGIGFDANSTDGTVWTIGHFTVTDGSVITGSGYYLQEVDTSSRFQLEDGSGLYLIEPFGGGRTFPPWFYGDLTGIGSPGRFFKDKLN